jgi:protein involved in polysaccharide export with SLBB domain
VTGRHRRQNADTAHGISRQEDVMLPRALPRLRFSLKSLFILSIGIAVGYTLNLRTWQVLTGAASEARKMTLPTYVIEPPDILSIEVIDKAKSNSPAIAGQHLVAMDGRVNLDRYGSVYVAGMTIAEATDAISEMVARQIPSPQVLVDVLAYNSKVYYIVQRGGPGFGDNVTRAPITGNDTVLDAIAQLGGLRAPEVTELSIARPSANGASSEQILTVDWPAISSGADAASNYQLLPGDRVVINRNFATKAPPTAAAATTPQSPALPDYYLYVRPQLESRQRQADAQRHQEVANTTISAPTP